MKIKIFLMGILLLSICCCDVETSKLSIGASEKLIENFRYKKDKRVDLCFAIVASRKFGNVNSSGLAVTEVPCTAKVEKLIEEQNE